MKINILSKLFSIIAKNFAQSIDSLDKPKSKTKIIKKFEKLSHGDLTIELRENEELKELQVFIIGKLSDNIDTSEKSVLAYLEENKDLFGLSERINNYKVVNIEKDDFGYTKVKVNQLINGSPIRGAELILHFDKDNVIKCIIGSVRNTINDITYLKLGSITEEDAIEIAKNEFEYISLRFEPKIDKQVIIKDDKAHEVYKINIQYLKPEIGNWDVLVEVSSGIVIDKISNIRYDGAIIGSGTAVDGSTKSINLYLSSSSYQMIDTTKPMSGQIKTYTAENRSVEPGTLVENSTSNFTTENFKTSVSAHYYAGVVYDFYKDLFNRNSIDNKEMNIISTTHYGSSYNNAFWDGNQMVYGDGDRTEFTYLSGDLDVVAHELTHGVTQYTANLNYSNQSGALNESISDVFGVLVETYYKYNVKNGGTWTFDSADWVVGNEIYTPSIQGDALRSLANPKLYGQPDNISGYLNTTSDNGGVHTNSGIPNKAAFLIAQAIGCSKTAQIYYRALTSYLTSSSDFITARNALVQSAIDFYGVSSQEVTAVNSAFDFVGITAFNDPYETNNTMSKAYLINSGSIYSSYISSSSDVDYYKFAATNKSNIKIKLSNLPKDYDLYLYDNNGNLLAKSVKPFTFSESISYVAEYTGIYYILIKGYNAAYSTTTKYNLKATF